MRVAKAPNIKAPGVDFEWVNWTGFSVLRMSADPPRAVSEGMYDVMRQMGMSRSALASPAEFAAMVISDREGTLGLMRATGVKSE